MSFYTDGNNWIRLEKDEENTIQYNVSNKSLLRPNAFL